MWNFILFFFLNLMCKREFFLIIQPPHNWLMRLEFLQILYSPIITLFFPFLLFLFLPSLFYPSLLPPSLPSSLIFSLPLSLSGALLACILDWATLYHRTKFLTTALTHWVHWLELPSWMLWLSFPAQLLQKEVIWGPRITDTQMYVLFHCFWEFDTCTQWISIIFTDLS